MPSSGILRALAGIQALDDGWYSVRPSQVKDLAPLRRMRNEAEAATRLVKPEQRNRASMLAGGIEDLIGARSRAVSLGMHDTEPTRGLLHLTNSGRPDATAAIDLEYGKNYLRGQAKMGHDDPFFREFNPVYLNHVATDSPEIQGSAVIRRLQEMYGPSMLFQVADPATNIRLYERMGAKRAPLGIDGSDILGDPDMPAFFFEDFARHLPRAEKQLPLPLE